MKLFTNCPICAHGPLFTVSRRADLAKYSPESREVAEAYMAMTGETEKREILSFCGHCRAVYRAWFFDDAEIERIYYTEYLKLEASVLNSKGYVYNKPAFLSQASDAARAVVRRIEEVTGRKEKIIFDIGGRDGFRLMGLSEDGYECVVYDPIDCKPCTSRIRKFRAWLSEIEPEARADIIFLCHVLEHTVDARRMIRECSEHLTATGFLYVEIPSDIEQIFNWLLFHLWRGRNLEIDLTHFMFFSRSSVYLLLESCGFQIVECEFKKVNVTGNTVIGIVARKCLGAPQENFKRRSLASHSPAFDLFSSGYVWGLPRKFVRKIRSRLRVRNGTP